jgi:predicted nucleic-acid-binding protein
MRITADANLLVRVIVADDAEQSMLAETELAHADLVALPLVALCEMVWTLSRAYKLSKPQIALAVRTLVNSHNVVTDHSAIEAGLAMLEAGGDFADGVIAHEGSLLGGQVFVSFDKQAVQSVIARGGQARLPIDQAGR